MKAATDDIIRTTYNMPIRFILKSDISQGSKAREERISRVAIKNLIVWDFLVSMIQVF